MSWALVLAAVCAGFVRKEVSGDGSVLDTVEAVGSVLDVVEEVHKAVRRDEPAVPPKFKGVDQWICDGGAHYDVVRKLGQGMEGQTFEVKTKGSDLHYVLKVPHDRPQHKRAVKRECALTQVLAQRSVPNAMECVAYCEYGILTEAGKLQKGHLFTPLVKQPTEFGTLPIQLGASTHAAVGNMLEMTWKLLEAGVVDVDRANNVLYQPDGTATFIDFGRAIDVQLLAGSEKDLKAFQKSMPRILLRGKDPNYLMFVKQQLQGMLQDLFGTVPTRELRFAQEKLAELKAARPLPAFGPIDLAALVDERLEALFESAQNAVW